MSLGWGLEYAPLEGKESDQLSVFGSARKTPGREIPPQSFDGKADTDGGGPRDRNGQL